MGWPNRRNSGADGWLVDHPSAYRMRLRPATCRWCNAPLEVMPSWSFRCPVCDVPPPRRQKTPA